jgi:hypothetical protein
LSSLLLLFSFHGSDDEMADLWIARGGQYGDKTNMTTGSSAGTHYAGGGAATHNCPPSDERHEGDMVRPGDACEDSS